jgi:hypothetical protein
VKYARRVWGNSGMTDAELFAMLMDIYFDNDYSWGNIERACALINRESYLL